LRPD
jgi:hypothetical protein